MAAVHDLCHFGNKCYRLLVKDLAGNGCIIGLTLTPSDVRFEEMMADKFS